MIVRSEPLLAMLLPAIAVSWVVADSTIELVAADRSFAAAASAVHIVRANETSIAVEAKASEETATICSPDGTVVAGIASIADTQETLRRLCQAGLKFAASLPKT
jgi:hypothetical protein